MLAVINDLYCGNLHLTECVSHLVDYFLKNRYLSIPSQHTSMEKYDLTHQQEGMEEM